MHCRKVDKNERPTPSTDLSSAHRLFDLPGPQEEMRRDQTRLSRMRAQQIVLSLAVECFGRPHNQETCDANQTETGSSAIAHRSTSTNAAMETV
jgi:hypothetical protein